MSRLAQTTPVQAGTTLSCTNHLMRPVATPPNAIVFGSRCDTIPQMAGTGPGLNLRVCC